MVSPFTATSHSQYSSAVAFASMFSQSVLVYDDVYLYYLVRIEELALVLHRNPAVPGQAVSSPEQAAAPRQRQTARIMTRR